MNDIKQVLAGYIRQHTIGLLSASECIMRIDNTIQKATNNETDIDNRIRLQNKLYKYALSNLVKAINRTERL